MNYNSKYDYWYEDAGLIGPIGFFLILGIGMFLIYLLG